MKKKMLILGLLFLPLTPCSCKSRPAVPVRDTEEEKDTVALAVEDAVEEEAGTGVAPEESKQRCLGEFLHDEADRRKKERALEPVYVEAKRKGLLIDIIDLAAAGAVDRKIEGVVPETEALSKGIVSEQDLSFIKNVLGVRLTAYASCMSVAARDASWCKSLSAVWKDGGLDCYKVFATYVLIGQDALKGGKSCGDVLKGFKIFDEKDSLAYCEALVGQKPELCPWEELSMGNVNCQAAASRARLNICSKGKFDMPEREIYCCEQFGWRFSSAVDGSADPYIIPEAGAITGEEKGCLQSLTWGLLRDLGPVFGMEVGEIEKATNPETFGHYLCPLTIYWTDQEVP